MDTTSNERVRLYLSADTCRLAAQLRASYAATGLAPATLGQVIEDAIEFFHYKSFEHRGIPSNWEDFTKRSGDEKR